MSGTTYETPKPDELRFLHDAIDSYHGDRLQGVRVGMLMALAPVDEETGEIKAPALKHHGWPCLALARIVPTKDRVAGLPDAMIYVDGDAWKGMTKAERLALIDHELTHFDFPAKRGEDCHGRPKLKLRPHDHEFGWFDEVAERHRLASQEVRQAQRFATTCGQLYLLGHEDDADAEPVQMEIASRPIEAKARLTEAAKRLGDTKVTIAAGGRSTTTTMTRLAEVTAEVADGLTRPAGLQVADELVAAIGKVKATTLRDRVDALLSVELSVSTVTALLCAEQARASMKPRTTFLGFLEKHASFDVEVTDADQWAALLLCHSVGAPKLEHVERGVPLIADLAVVRYVQGLELARGKAARAVVIQLCEERLAELFEQGGAS